MTRPARTRRAARPATPEGAEEPIFVTRRVVCCFAVPGRAIPWSAPTVTRSNGTYKARPLVAWQHHVRLCAQVEMAGRQPWTGPVALDLVVTGRPPKGKRPGDHWAARPDATNLQKALEDALSGVVYRDDCQVVRVITAKQYGPRDEVFITVTALS